MNEERRTFYKWRASCIVNAAIDEAREIERECNLTRDELDEHPEAKIALDIAFWVNNALEALKDESSPDGMLDWAAKRVHEFEEIYPISTKNVNALMDCGFKRAADWMLTLGCDKIPGAD